MSKPRHRPRSPRVSVGSRVVATHGQLEGIDPFTPLVVTARHRDGTVDLEVEAECDSRVWSRVQTRWLWVI
jgi:hypothetical protein